MNTKKHSKYSPSAAKRWINCPGVVGLVGKLGIESKESSSATEGTLAHELASTCLTTGISPQELKGKLIKELNGDQFSVTDEMIGYITEYLNIIKEYEYINNGIEYCVNIIIDSKNPDNSVYGTLDYFCYNYSDELHVFDLKYGVGVEVDAEDNFQLKCYAFGLLNNFTLAKRIFLHIIQPRSRFGNTHKVWETTPEDIYSFGEKILNAKDSAENAPYFSSGSHCQFCPVIHECPELRNKALDVAKTDFATDLTEYKTPEIVALNVNQIDFLLRLEKPLTEYLKGVRIYATGLAESGTEIPNHELKLGRKTRTWKNPEYVAQNLEKILGDQTWNKKIISPYQLEAIVKKPDEKLKSWIEDQIETIRGDMSLKEIK